MAGQQPILNYLPGFFSSLAFLLTLLTIIPGINHALLHMYYLKTDASNLSVPSKLANSTFLIDLSSVSGTDFVGQDATSSSLGLSETYFVYLLTSCAQNGRSTDCASPHVGFSFKAGADLKLDSTALQGSFGSKYLNALSSYSKLSGFIAAAYIISCAILLITPLSLILSYRFPRIRLFAAANSVLATILLLAANLASMITFKNVNRTFNDAFNSSGLTSTLGTALFITSWVAFAASLLASIVYIIRAHNPGATRRRGRLIGADVKPGGAIITGAESTDHGQDTSAAQYGGPKKAGLFSRIPTWKRHSYVQVENQPALLKTDVPGQEARVVVVSPNNTRRPLNDDWAPEDDYDGSSGRGIALRSLVGSNKPRRDMDAAYEPYNSTM